MACGEFGPGRMQEPDAIAARVAAELSGKFPHSAGALEGRKILVTAGPTHEPIDPVRFIANRSSGKQGYAVAAALAAAGAETHLVSGPTQLDDPKGVNVTRVETAMEMLAACQNILPVDAAIMTAAVADWRPVDMAAQKMKKSKTGAPACNWLKTRTYSPICPKPGPADPRWWSGLRRRPKTLKPMPATSWRAKVRLDCRQ